VSRRGGNDVMEQAPEPPPEAGEQGGLQAISHDEREKLVRLSESLLKDRHDAEDVVQDTLIVVWKQSASRTPGDLKAYLNRAVYVNSLKRRARRRQVLPLDREPVAPLAKTDEPAGLPRISPVELERAIRGLPETQQAVIRLKYYVGMSFREIGQSLSISMNTASSRCRYALDYLRGRLANKETEGDEDDGRKS
jgi:RNA polymerase sigma factor (sigma-70 family)